MIKIPEAPPGLKRKRLGPPPTRVPDCPYYNSSIPTDNLNTGLLNGEVIETETTPELVLFRELSTVLWHCQVLRVITEQNTLAQVLLRTIRRHRQGVRGRKNSFASQYPLWTHLHGPALKPFLKRFSPSREISARRIFHKREPQHRYLVLTQCWDSIFSSRLGSLEEFKY